MFLGAWSNHFLDMFMPVLHVQFFKKIGTWKCNSRSTHHLCFRNWSRIAWSCIIQKPQKYVSKFKTQNKSILSLENEVPNPSWNRHPIFPRICRSSSNAPPLPPFLEMLQNDKTLMFCSLLTKSAPSASVFCTFDFEMCFAPQRRALSRHLNFQKWSGAGVVSTFWLRNVLHTTTACAFSTSQLPKVVRSWCGFYVWLRNVLHTTTACTFSTSQLPKVVRSWCGFYVLTSKCASHHNGVHFFDISTSKSGPELVWFLRFDFEMCFTPQRRALFRHLNFQKWSGAGVVSTFWLSKCASHHNGVHFFDISTSKSGPELVWFLHFDFEMCFTPQRRALFRHLNFQKWSGAGVVSTFLTSKCASHHNGVHFFDISTSKSGPELVWFLRFDFEVCFTPQRRALFLSTSQLPKVVRSWCGFYVLTSKCASRYTGVCFFDIATSKSGPELVWFLRFDFEMCFTPQRRALFRHLNFQKWSGAGVVSPFWLRSVLRATPACAFSTSQLPKVVRSWCAFVHFDLEMCFAPQRRASSSLIWPAGSAPAQIIGTTQCFATVSTFSRTWIFFLLRLSLFWSSFFFSSLLFSDSSHLCFSFVHIVGSLTSKLPSTRSTNSALGSCSSLCLSCEHRLAEVRYVGGWWLH